ncbi:hypothetical protein CYY_010459, partial [Polysphondylium violaceum]
MKATSIVVIVFFAFIVLSVNAVAPVIDSLILSWGRVGKTISIIGSNFGTETPTVWVDGLPAATNHISDTVKSFTMYGSDTARQWTISVSNLVDEMSNSLVLFAGGTNPDQFYQINEKYFIVGDFGQIPLKDSLKVTRNGNDFYGVTYINSTHMSFNLILDLAQSPFKLYYGSYLEGTYNTPGQYAPVIDSSAFTNQGLSIGGYVFNQQTVVKTGSTFTSTCKITTQTVINIYCVPEARSLLNPVNQFQVTLFTGKQTTIPVTFTHLQSFLNDINNICILKLAGFQNNLGLPTQIDGLGTVSAISASLVSISEIKFTYPLDAKCGYAFVFAGTTRLTNNMLLCPRSVISTVDAPRADNGYVLTVNGYFMNPYLFDPTSTLQVQALTFSYVYADGITHFCPVTQVVWQPSNSSYTLTCTIGTPKAFKFYINSTVAESNFFLVGKDPIVISATPTDYLVPGVVTIIGDLFTSQPKVKIGNVECIPATLVNNTMITCMFPSNVAVSNFKNPLSVQVSLDLGFTSNAFVFLYNRPNPVITGATSTIYGIAGKVTVTGFYFYSENPVFVSIGGVECLFQSGNGDGTGIVCTFPSTAGSQYDYDTPLSVHVSIDNTYNATTAVFYYFRPNPIITSSTSTTYGTPGQVTITGNFFSSKGLVVSIDGTPCTSPTVIGVTQIVCTFSSNTVVSNFKTPLAITVKDSLYTVTNSVFYYVRPNPVVSSATPTKYLSAGQVTITGKYFSYPDSLSVTIGASICSSPVASQDGNTITC